MSRRTEGPPRPGDRVRVTLEGSVIEVGERGGKPAALVKIRSGEIWVLLDNLAPTLR